MNTEQPSRLSTPRTDAAERFFYDSGRPPMGFVDSGLARVLEFELARALNQLQQAGGPLPPPLDERTLAQLREQRRPKGAALSKIEAAQTAAGPAAAAQPPAQVRLLQASLASASLGQPRSYGDGAVLFRSGEQAEHVFVILQGQVRVGERRDQGSDCTLGPGSVFAAHALFEESLHTQTLHAQGPVETVQINAAQMRQRLSADASMLPFVLMGLILQQHMVAELAWQQGQAQLPATYALLGERAYTGPELQRVLLEDSSRLPGERLGAEQRLALQLQASEHCPVRMFRAGETLGAPGQEHSGLAILLVSGKAQVQYGEHNVELGQGALIGLAEGLSGIGFSGRFIALQDLNARVIPIERSLQQLEKADPVLRALAGHACAISMSRQAELAGTAQPA